MTQMHFAELSIKMRQLGITLAGGTLAIAILLYKTDSDYVFKISNPSIEVPISSLLMIAAAAILSAAWIVDVGVYHKMLRGAVKFNELFERKMEAFFDWDAGLTETISAYSRYKEPFLLDKRARDGKIWSKVGKASDAGKRISWFYRLSVFALLFASGLLMYFHNTGGEVFAI